MHLNNAQPLRRVLIVIALLCFSVLTFNANPPPWWSGRYVTDSGNPQTNYSAANLGQLKNFAVSAYEELRSSIPSHLDGIGNQTVSGPSAKLRKLIEGWIKLDTSGNVLRDGQGRRIMQDDPSKMHGAANDYASLSHGQLKSVAKLFYDRLIELDPTWSYPWTTQTSDDANYAIANIGQLKHVFNFDPGRDSDSDGVSNIKERVLINNDVDGDGLPDSWEIRNGLSTEYPDDGLNDIDGDGHTNAQEYAAGTDPLAPDTPPLTSGPPDAPSNVRVQRNTDGSMVVTWVDNSHDETYFIVRDRRSDGTTVELGRVGPGKTRLFVPPPK